MNLLLFPADRRDWARDPTRPLAMCYGSGVNSLAAAVEMKRRGIRPDVILFSDTRDEKPATYRHAEEVLKPWLAAVGFPPLTVICRADFQNSKTGDASLEAECLRLGNVPSRAFGFSTCADKWKIDPFKWWMKTWPPAIEAWARGGLVTRAIGFDANEERRVGTKQDKGFAKWFPLIEWGMDRDACLALIRDEGLEPPPKSACFYCPSSTKTEILALAKEHPDLMQRAIDMEAKSNATKRWSIAGLGRRFAWADLLAADAATRARLPEAPVESCTTCTEGSCDV